MRINRAKQARRHLRFFRLTFGVVPPYQVLLDGTFLVRCLRSNVAVRDRMRALLQTPDCMLCMPRGALNELKRLAEEDGLPAARDAVAFVESGSSSCEVVEDEFEEGMTSTEHILALVRRAESKFFVASQDEDLRARLRQIPGVPLVFLNRVVLLLDPPSQATLDQHGAEEAKKTDLSQRERDLVRVAEEEKEETGYVRKPENGSVMLYRKSAKRAKEPNPLSVKKPDPSSAKQRRKQKDKFRRKRGG